MWKELFFLFVLRATACSSSIAELHEDETVKVILYSLKFDQFSLLVANSFYAREPTYLWGRLK